MTCVWRLTSVVRAETSAAFCTCVVNPPDCASESGMFRNAPRVYAVSLNHFEVEPVQESQIQTEFVLCGHRRTQLLVANLILADRAAVDGVRLVLVEEIR